MCKSTYLNLLFRRGFLLLLFPAVLINQTTAQASDGEKRVTLNEKNAQLKNIFSKITEQTQLYFAGNADKLDPDEQYTINVKNETVNNVLGKLLSGKGFTWIIKDNVIAILKQTSLSLDKQLTDQSKIDSLISIFGKITNEKSEPIAGATVLIKESNIGATSMQDGSFRINAIKRNSTLVISSIAYLTKEVSIKGKSDLGQIWLKEYVGILDETQVIAYGTTSRRLSIGNVGSVRAAEIEKQPVNNPLLALQGRVPGLFIEQASGLAGTGVKVRIQGQNSLNRGNDPLYVIDGVPYTSQLLPSLNNILGTSGGLSLPSQLSGSGNPLSFINPADIESIEILKDADATSIYGSRAAAGAILITTKKGKSGTTTVSINAQSGFGQVPHFMELLKTKEYMQMRKEALINDGLSVQPTDYDINGFWDSTKNTNWQKELIGKTSKYSDIQASISGGNSNTKFLFGTGYHKETPVFPGDFFDKKGSAHFNIDNTSNNQNFIFSFSGNYVYDDNQLPNNDYAIVAKSMSPNSPNLLNNDGSINWAQDANGSSTLINPLASYGLVKYKNKTTNLISSALLSYEIIKGLSVKGSFGYNELQSNEVITTPMNATQPEIRQFGDNLRNASYGNNKINAWIIEPQISYKSKINNGTAEILIGSTFNKISNNGIQQFAYGFNSDLVLNDIKSASSSFVSSTLNSVYKYSAVFSRITYNERNKYIVNFTVRRDGSSRFGAQNRFNNFGSIGAAWIISEEPFFKKYSNIVSYAKLRSSYGTTGNDQIGNYQFLSLYQATTADLPYLGGTGLSTISLKNPYIQWEETRKLQIGLDIGVLGDKILINSSYYRNRSSNQLLNYSLPIFAGFNNIQSNFPAIIQNSGLEVSINTVNIKNNNFNWSTQFNITVPKNKLVDFPNISTSTYADQLTIGQPFTSLKVLQYRGVDPQTGIYIFSDSHGQPTSYPDLSTDMIASINTSPRFYGGLSNQVSYKSFSLDLLLQFVKQTGFNYNLGNYPGLINNNQPTTILSRWKAKGDITNIQKYNSDFSIAEQFGNAAFNSDVAYSDASFIRLKNVSFSWNVPIDLLKRLHIKIARIYVQAQNVLTVTNYLGFDPEARSTSTPPLRVVSLGLQLSL